MSVLTRDALEASPLADLHTLASELGLDGYRRLRKAELIDAILERQGGDSGSAQASSDDEGEKKPRRSRRRRRDRDESTDEDSEPEAEEPKADKPKRAPRERSQEREPEVQESAEGVVELQSGGSALLKRDGGDDVYVSAAQVRRCELVDGDTVSGPVRPARRSEKHPSLARVEQINGRSADEVAGGTPYDAMPCEPPKAALPVSGVTSIAIGRGSRVTVCGAPLTGKSELLRALAVALKDADGVETLLVLAGSRPEEASLWAEAGLEAHGAAALPAAPDSRAKVIEAAIDNGRRIAARGQDVVVIIDSLEGLERGTTRRALGAARNLTEAGSLTVIAAAPAPIGGETAIIALDAARAARGEFPAIDAEASRAFRADLIG